MASRAPSPDPTPTPANRPKRVKDKDTNRRRSTRLLEEEMRGLDQVPVLADIGELHSVLASIAQRHFRETNIREVDALSSFMSAIKTKGSMHGRWQ